MQFDWGDAWCGSWIRTWLNSLTKSLLWLLSRWLVLLLLLSLCLWRRVLLRLSLLTGWWVLLLLLLLLPLIIVQVTILLLRLLLGWRIIVVWITLIGWLLLRLRVLLIPLSLRVVILWITWWWPHRLWRRLLSILTTTIVVSIVCLFLGTSDLVRDFLFLVSSILLLVGFGVSLILATKNVELLVTTRLVRHSYRCLEIRLRPSWLLRWGTLPLILCGLLICSNFRWILVSPGLSDRCTSPIPWNIIAPPSNTEWAITSYKQKK